MAKEWFRLSAQETVDELKVDPAQGLSAEEAAARLSTHGANALAEAEQQSALGLLLVQFKVIELDPMAMIFQFNTIRTDILNRSSTHPPRNQCQILKTVPSMLQRTHDHLMPLMTRTNFEENVRPIFVHLKTPNFRSQDNALKLGFQDNQIAPTSQN